jgi:plasmid stability protein
MAARAITLQLPAPLYDHFQSRARQARRSVEAELLETVATAAAGEEELPGDVALALSDLELLSDDELRRAARNRLSSDVRSRLEGLNLKQQRERLAPAEREALEGLVRQYDQSVLLRAEAVRLLKQRGQDVSDLLAAA